MTKADETRVDAGQSQTDQPAGSTAASNEPIRRRLQFAAAQLRHAYANLNGASGTEGPPLDKSQAKRFAAGLIAPQIRTLEEVIQVLDVMTVEQPACQTCGGLCVYREDPTTKALVAALREVNTQAVWMGANEWHLESRVIEAVRAALALVKEQK